MDGVRWTLEMGDGTNYVWNPIDSRFETIPIYGYPTQDDLDAYFKDSSRYVIES